MAQPRWRSLHMLPRWSFAFLQAACHRQLHVRRSIQMGLAPPIKGPNDAGEEHAMQTWKAGDGARGSIASACEMTVDPVVCTLHTSCKLMNFAMLLPRMDTRHEGFASGPHPACPGEISPPRDYKSEFEFLVAVLLLIQNFLGTWKDIDADQVQMARCSGAMSNLVYQISRTPCSRGEQTSSYLLRLFGNGHTAVSPSKKLESSWMNTLSLKNVSSGVLVEFPNGRIESFLDDYDASTIDEIRDPEMSRKIALCLAKFHSCSGELRVVTKKFIESSGPPDLSMEALDFWAQIKGDYEKAVQTDLLKNDSKFNSYAKSVKEDLNFGAPFCLHFSKLDKIMNLVGAAESVHRPWSVFGHFDLQNANIMIKRRPSRSNSPIVEPVILLDYEYAGFGSRAADIANHFCEWMSSYSGERPFQLNVGKFPSDEQMINFVNAYLEEAVRLDGGPPFATSVSEWTDSNRENILREILFYSSLASIKWTLWAVLQFCRRTSTWSREDLQAEVVEDDIKSCDSVYFYLAYAKHRFSHFETLMHRQSSLLGEIENLTVGEIRALFPLTTLAL